MTEIHYKNLVEALLEAIPELRSRYDSWRKELGEDLGPHVVFGDVLDPHLETLLESKGHDEQLRRIFAFLEQLANHEDVHVREVVQVTVCEELGDREGSLKKARQYMGQNTRRLFDEMEKELGRKQ